MIGIAHIKYPDGETRKIAIVELTTSQDGIIGMTDTNGTEYLTHISNVVIEVEK